MTSTLTVQSVKAAICATNDGHFALVVGRGHDFHAVALTQEAADILINDFDLPINCEPLEAYS